MLDYGILPVSSKQGSQGNPPSRSDANQPEEVSPDSSAGWAAKKTGKKKKKALETTFSHHAT